MRIVICLMIVCGLLSQPTKAVEPIDIGHNWQLFLDDHVIARSTGLTRVLHHPRPRGPVLSGDKPWESYGTELLYGTPVGRREDGSFYMFYRAMWWAARSEASSDRPHDMTFSVGYATSKDGIRWEKPILGLTEAPAEIRYKGIWPEPVGETKENNIGVPIMDPTDLGTYGDVSDPQKRFLFRIPDAKQAALSVTGGQWEAYFSSQIPDFLNDPKWREKLTPTGSTLNPRRHFLNFWDVEHKEWVAMEQGVGGHFLPSREIARFASKDLKQWYGESVLYPDAEDSHRPEYYDEAMTLHPYCAEGVVLGLLSWFHSNRTDPSGGPTFKPTNENPHHWPWTRKGVCDTRITISRDGGKTWDRTVSREAFIPHSEDEHAYDRQTYRPAPPVRVGDEDYFYVTTMNGDHLVTRNNPGQDGYYHDRVVKMEISLYTQRHLGFVSMRAGAATSEELITKPLVLSGEKLELNVDASHGEVRVAIASAEGDAALVPHAAKPLSGYSFDDCKPILANSVAHAVEFNNGKGLKELAGKPVFLLVRIHDADLYGFRVAP